MIILVKILTKTAKLFIVCFNTNTIITGNSCKGQQNTDATVQELARSQYNSLSNTAWHKADTSDTMS